MRLIQRLAQTPKYKPQRFYYSEKSFIHRGDSDGPFLFTSESEKKLETIRKRYPPQYVKAAVIPYLHVAQAQLGGWVSLSAMKEVARLLEMPEMRVYEVATFYTMFRREPRGKHLIQVCTTTPCQLRGAQEIHETIANYLDLSHSTDMTTKDKLFTLEEVECAGACVNAPIMAIDDVYYEDLTAETAIEIVKNVVHGSPTAGPQSARDSCEPAGGLTSLTQLPPDPFSLLRKDL